MTEKPLKTAAIDRKTDILTTLTKADMSFTELHKSLSDTGWRNWSTRTLALYLKDLVKNGCITMVPRGKREIYRIVRDHPYVSGLLGRVRIKREIILKDLSEGELIEDWVESVNFAMVSVIKTYSLMGKGITELKNIEDGTILLTKKLLEENISDLLAVIQFYGRFLMEGISSKRLDSKKVLSANEAELKGAEK